MSSSKKPGKPAPERLEPEFHPRIWGSLHLEPFFPDQEQKIGEVWFRESDSTVLVKFLFTTDHLSVQVHPDDALAQQSGFPRGKTEMWHILRHDPGAQIALGFKREVTSKEVRAAALDGSISNLLCWRPVAAGQTWFIPAGTVHALGAGITLCEVQQNSDLTYRLFDYNRGRELHLDESLRAMSCAASDAEPVSNTKGKLVDCPHFQVSRVEASGVHSALQANLAVVLQGKATLGGTPVVAGEVWKLDPSWPQPFAGSAELLTVLTRT